MKRVLLLMMAALLWSCSVTETDIVEIDNAGGDGYMPISFVSGDERFSIDGCGDPMVRFPGLGGSIVLQMDQSFTSFECVATESWVSVEVDSKLSTMCISVGRNDNPNVRTAVAVIDAYQGGKRYSGSVIVVQNGNGTPELYLGQPEYYFPPTSEYGSLSHVFEVQTNQDVWSFEYDRNEWLHIVKDGNSLVMSVIPNAGLYRREVDVTVVAGSGSDKAERTIRIIQDAKSFVVVSNTFSISYNTVTTHIPISSNYDWKAVSSDSWLSVTKDRNGNLLLSSETNKGSTDKRVATVTITSGPADNNIAQAQIAVTQYGYNGRSMVLETITSAQGTIITLPLAGEVDCTIDWGDGNVEKVVSPYPQHKYEYPGFHMATITGKVTELNVEGMSSFMKYYLTGVAQWGNTGLRSLHRAFYGCENLRFVADDTESSFTEVISFEEVFSGCLRLQNIPDNLFDSAVNAKSFYGAFQGCAFIPVIPEGLFDNAVSAQTFRFVFGGCTSIKEIPEGLFGSNVNAENFYGAFYGCTSLKSVPADLFRNNAKATSFGSLFYGCRALESIPDGLFDACPDVSTFSGAFFNCTSLKEIPSDLFDNNRKVTIWSDTFAGCSSLGGESPFTVVEGHKIHLYERNAYPELFSVPTTTAGCFRSAAGLSDYGKIPASWR